MSEHQWKFFVSTEATWQELLSACARATERIDLEEFAFGYPGDIEEQFIKLFLTKAKAGVKVRLLLDAVGSFSFYHCDAFKQLTEAGVEINYHFAVVPTSLKRILPVVLRDHRKLLIIDGKEGHIGGVIIEERARSWRDTFVRIEGPVVKDLQGAFDISWNRTLKNHPVEKVSSKNGQKEFTVIGNTFHLRNKDLYRAFLKAITGAKQNVYVTTPYFFPTRELLRAFKFALSKGVEVVFLFPKVSDNKLADFLARLFFKKLLKSGMRIFLYEKSILHAKTMVIDGNWATIGSCNLDLLSLWWNYELNIVSTNFDFARELEKHFHNDLKNSQEVL